MGLRWRAGLKVFSCPLVKLSSYFSFQAAAALSLFFAFHIVSVAHDINHFLVQKRPDVTLVSLFSWPKEEAVVPNWAAARNRLVGIGGSQPR